MGVNKMWFKDGNTVVDDSGNPFYVADCPCHKEINFEIEFADQTASVTDYNLHYEIEFADSSATVTDYTVHYEIEFAADSVAGP